MPRELDSAALLAKIGTMSHDEIAKTLALLEELDHRKRIRLAQNDLMAFIAAVDPTYKFGAHLKRLGKLLMETESGLKDRIAVSMAPRFGKSQLISIYFPAWYLGRHPANKLIMASHTGDLAVDMARKVRNLMQSDDYKQIFPGVQIAADAKAAGKWNTTKGGEVFAVGVGGAVAGRGAHLCLDPFVRVHTRERGVVAAGTVQRGEHLLSWHGWAEVQAVIRPLHTTTVTVAGRLRVSAEHPVWTFNRGWVPAADLRVCDFLWTMTLFDKIKFHLQEVVYGTRTARAVQNSDLQHLGADVAALYQPEGRKLYFVRRLRRYCMRALEGLCAVLRRYGASAFAGAYTGPHRLFSGVLSRELPVGGRRYAAKQPHQRTPDHGIWPHLECDAVGAGGRYNKGHGCASDFRAWYAPGDGIAGPKNEPQQAGGYSEVTGWFRAGAVRLLSRCWSVFSAIPGSQRTNKEGYLERFARKSQDLLGLLLGVRPVGQLKIERHEPRPFVNFMVGGDHTFIGDNVLSHNCIVDDPISEQDIKNGQDGQLDAIYEWFRAGLRTRLMPGGKLCILHTRWHQRDLIGRLMKDGMMNPDGDQYEMFEFPAILTVSNPLSDPKHAAYDPEAPAEVEKSLWPEQWSLESLQKTRASMPAWQWNAQYQQNPTAQEAALIKRDHIKWWPKEKPPECEFVIQSYDTALTTKERSDYSVCQTWGVFEMDDGNTGVILLNQVKGKWEFPELKKMAHEQFEDWEPDSVIVEAKASGQPLIDEMRRSGIFVQDFSPGKGQDKIARVNAVVDMFYNGQVWFPETSWATETVEELLAFPSGEHDDAVDACTLALMRVRKGGLVRLASDKVELEDRISLPRRQAYY